MAEFPVATSPAPGVMAVDWEQRVDFDRQINSDDESWLGDINVKTFGVLRAIRAFLPHMATDGTGRITNTSVTVTLDTYTHLFEGDLDEVMDRLDACSATKSRLERVLGEVVDLPLRARTLGT